jgi:hypothetical protein
LATKILSAADEGDTIGTEIQSRHIILRLTKDAAKNLSTMASIEKDSKVDSTANAEAKQVVTRFHEIEQHFGIDAYASSNNHEGFAAVLKARYSDFLVHEGKYFLL